MLLNIVSWDEPHPSHLSGTPLPQPPWLHSQWIWQCQSVVLASLWKLLNILSNAIDYRLYQSISKKTYVALHLHVSKLHDQWLHNQLWLCNTCHAVHVWIHWHFSHMASQVPCSWLSIHLARQCANMILQCCIVILQQRGCTRKQPATIQSSGNASTQCLFAIFTCLFAMINWEQLIMNYVLATLEVPDSHWPSSHGSVSKYLHNIVLRSKVFQQTHCNWLDSHESCNIVSRFAKIK